MEEPSINPFPTLLPPPPPPLRTPDRAQIEFSQVLLMDSHPCFLMNKERNEMEFELFKSRPERLESGGPCWLIKLR